MTRLPKRCVVPSPGAGDRNGRRGALILQGLGHAVELTQVEREQECPLVISPLADQIEERDHHPNHAQPPHHHM